MLHPSKSAFFCLFFFLPARACSWVTKRAIQRCPQETRTATRHNGLKIAKAAGTTPTAQETNPTRLRSDRRCPPGRCRAERAALSPGICPRPSRAPGALRGWQAGPLPSSTHAGASLPPPGERRRRDRTHPPPRRRSWHRDGMRGERVLAQVGTRRLPGRSSGAGGGCFPATLISSHAAGVVLSDGRLGGTRRLRHRLPNARPYR